MTFPLFLGQPHVVDEDVVDERLLVAAPLAQAAVAGLEEPGLAPVGGDDAAVAGQGQGGPAVVQLLARPPFAPGRLVSDCGHGHGHRLVGRLFAY